MLDVSSPRRRCESSYGRLGLRLGEGKANLGERGPPRCGQARLGEPGDSEDEISGLPKRDVGRLSQPLRLGKGRLRLSEPVT